MNQQENVIWFLDMEILQNKAQKHTIVDFMHVQIQRILYGSHKLNGVITQINVTHINY